MNVLSPTVASPNDPIVVEFAAGQKIDLSTINFHFNITTTSATATATVLPPKWSQSLIDNLSIEINGINVMSVPYYNHLYSLIMAYTAGDRAKSHGTFLEWSDNLPDALEDSKRLASVPMVWKNFLGFFANGKIIDTSLTGPIRLSIRLAGTNVLVQKTVVADASYTIQNMSVHYDVITINDGLYDQMLARKLEGGGVIALWESF